MREAGQRRVKHEIMLAQQEQATEPRTVAQVWRLVKVTSQSWEQGAKAAYCGSKMSRTEPSYVAGYLAQLEKLPKSAEGTIEWFRYRPDGGWKLTDNI